MLTRLRSAISRMRLLFGSRELEDRLHEEWRLHLELLINDMGIAPMLRAR